MAIKKTISSILSSPKGKARRQVRRIEKIVENCKANDVLEKAVQDNDEMFQREVQKLYEENDHYLDGITADYPEQEMASEYIQEISQEMQEQFQEWKINKDYSRRKQVQAFNRKYSCQSM